MITPEVGEVWRHKLFNDLVTVTAVYPERDRIEYVEHGFTTRIVTETARFDFSFTKVSGAPRASACDCGADKAGINRQGGGAHSHFCEVFTKERFK